MRDRIRLSRLRGNLEYLAYCLGAGVLLVFVAEIVLTFLPYQPPSSPLLVEFVNPEWQDEFLYRLDPELFWSFRPHARLRERRPDGSLYSVRLNNLGLRGADWPDPEAEGAFRILMVGDSCAFGVLTQEGQNLPEQLASMLRQAHPGRRIHVMNLGVPGYASLQARITLQQHGPLYHPNLVLVYSGSNDVLPRVRFTDREILLHYRGELRRQGRLEKSKLYATLRGLVGHATSQRPADVPSWVADSLTRVPMAESEVNFRAIIDYASDTLGAHVVVVLPPNLAPEHRVREVNALLSRLCAEKDVPTVDAHRLFANFPDPPMLYAMPDSDKVHPNVAGYRLIATHVFAVVEDHRWLDDPAPPPPGRW